MRKNWFFGIRVELRCRDVSFQKIFTGAARIRRSVEWRLGGSMLADFLCYTSGFSFFLYAGCTTAAFLQHSRIHTRML